MPRNGSQFRRALGSWAARRRAHRSSSAHSRITPTLFVQRRKERASTRSIAGSIFALQLVISVFLVLAAVAALLLQARSTTVRAAHDRGLAAAASFAHAPGLIGTLRGPNPSAVLQPMAEAARRQAQVDFVTVMDHDGIRYTHPDPNQIGRKFVGDLSKPLAGHTTDETVRGPLGAEEQVVVPVTDARGAVVGLVASGLTVNQVTTEVVRQLPLLLTAGALALILASGGTALISRRLRRQTRGLGPGEMTRMYEQHEAVLHEVREGVVIVSGEGRVLLANDEAMRLLGLPGDVEGVSLDDIELDSSTRELLTSPDAVNDKVLPVKSRLLAVNVRPTDRRGGPPGSVATLRDTTELLALAGTAEVARERLQLLYEMSVAVGTTLDVERTAQEFADFTTRGFADFATVDLVEQVLQGDAPPTSAPSGGSAAVCRVAVSGGHSDHQVFPPGEAVLYAAPTRQDQGFSSGRAMLVPDLMADDSWRGQGVTHAQAVLDYGLRSLITAPLTARGVFMGTANFWRAHDSVPYDEEDLSLADELAARAATYVDNARQFTREHTTAVTLQRSLLPGAVSEHHAIEVCHRYLPAHAGVGGDWFDVIPLSGGRVALVVGDVVGHGLHAAATMGRLRTAVHNFATLDMPPDELLMRLDELAVRIDQETADSADLQAIAGATCLYAIYDPAAGTCALARAGHPPPVFVLPDGSADLMDLPSGPPLGVGGMPFEAVERQLPEGTSLVFYTDGLVEDRSQGIDAGLTTLRTVLSASGRTPQETCTAVLDVLPPAAQRDDIALLVARTHVLPSASIATWELPPDPAVVATARADAARQLSLWDMADETVFTVELILSELITNAIRYSTGAVGVRLLRHDCLTCEVSDSSSTSPHMRYAAESDEGGRGLFMIAQLASRWGTRYNPRGKVIWAELSLP
ncbi:SpoIIE family protein phosphatase [Streptomyces kronopolitis]|uniref:SpoIIE family protein phosphatase n=1 Tax=Streptomyces kronopolitis TaxID=1612435 RepID=UPI00369A6B1C